MRSGWVSDLMTRGSEISERGFMPTTPMRGMRGMGRRLPAGHAGNDNHSRGRAQPQGRRELLHDESVAHRVPGPAARIDELEQVVGAARLGADAGPAVAAERLSPDHRAGDVAVDVEVAHGQ